jgi:ABC-type multidrug transport system fused ATPase/permease subunit
LTVVIGSLVLAGYEFGVADAVHAVSTLTIFMAASSRITPAILRVQQNLLTMKQSSGSVERTFELINEIGDEWNSTQRADSTTVEFDYSDFNPEIEIKALHFSYPNDSSFQISNLTLSIKSGQSVAFVGPSGAGKTTIIDLILGVLEPASGEIIISGVTPLTAARKWPGAISYVPQNIFISSGTVRENVSLGFPSKAATDFRVRAALEAADLWKVVSDLPEDLDTPLREHGARISGGQRQRIGIARALFTEPKILVLDEATSALDAQSEKAIGNSIQKLSGKVTVIIVAHRLSTVRGADHVVYIDEGKILAQGTFEEVRMNVPDFDTQATLMGL